MTTIEHNNTISDTRYTVYNTSTGATKGLMSLQRPIEQPASLNFSAVPVTLTTQPVYISQERAPQIPQEPLQESLTDARTSQLEVPAALNAGISSENKTGSETSSVTSYDSDKENDTNKEIKRQTINLEESQEKKPVTDVNVGKQGEVVGAVEVKGFGNRGHYLSEGSIIFRVKQAKFRPNSKVDSKVKPYFKFRLGLNSAKSKNAEVRGRNLVCGEEIKVKYTNQDQVRIKVKGKGMLMDNTIASTKVSIVDVVMEGKQTMWAPLLKGDEVIGEVQLEMEFAPKK